MIGAALYFVFAFVMIRLTSNGRDIAAVWVANAILVGLLASQARPKWLPVILSGFIANVVANLLTRDAVLSSLLYGGANMAEVLAAAWLLRAAVGETSVLGSLETFFRFILISFAAPMLSGIVGAVAAWWVFNQAFLLSWASWSVSDALGILVFTPFFLALFRGEYARCFAEKSGLQRLETLALLGLVVASAGILFFLAEQVPIFVLFVPTMLVTIRLGPLGTKAAVMLIAIVGLASTFVYPEAVAGDTANREQALILQIFLFVLLFSSLPVAADLTARGSVAAALGRRERELTQLATTDGLTGLMNRSAFIDLASRTFAGAQRQQICLVAIDVDHFKQINDTWGHHVGDDALRHLASVAGAHLRSGDALSRFGGDEFMLLLPGATVADAERVCTRLRENLRRAPLPLEEGGTLIVSVSCGIASTEQASTFVELSKHADAALYAAKSAGRGTHRRAIAAA